MQTYQLIFLLASTILLAGISWRSLGDPHHHGFYRFIAWEVIIIQITIHLPSWFVDPLRWNQLISWLLLLISILVVSAGFYFLRSYGGGGARNVESSNYEIENTAYLVTRGIYAYIRHPIYCSLLLFVMGVFFKFLSLTGGVLALLASGFVYLTAKIEEKENIQTFGTEYLEYMITSKMFFPGLF
ncbi:MAG: isoprenylcysteine carboxylmethyltransferase family protein [Calditrichae bacterium]|nr:isoprenylcysteine carboxylmethyltransferase family protein [Calditrichia bacterium]